MDLNRRGFTLLELALVLAIAGGFAYGSFVLLGKVWREKQRVAIQKDLADARATLLEYAYTYKALPSADPGPLFPVSLNAKVTDATGRALKYCVNAALTSSNGQICKFQENLDATTAPRVWERTTPKDGMPVAAVLVSRSLNGVFDAYAYDFDGDGEADEVFDNGETGCLTTPFVDAPLLEDTFDDQLVYLTVPELYALVCQ